MEAAIITAIVGVPNLMFAGVAVLMLFRVVTILMDLQKEITLALLAMHPPQQIEDSKNTVGTGS